VRPLSRSRRINTRGGNLKRKTRVEAGGADSSYTVEHDLSRIGLYSCGEQGSPYRGKPAGIQGRAQDFRFGYSEFPKDKFLA
jgi:hypothetical protein